MEKKKEKKKSKKKTTKYTGSDYSFEDNVAKVTISKSASPKLIQLLSDCNFNCEVVIKK